MQLFYAVAVSGHAWFCYSPGRHSRQVAAMLCDRHDTRAPWDKVSEVKPQTHSYINVGLPSCGTSWGYMVIGSQRWHKQPWGVSPTWNVEDAFPRFTIFDCDTFPQFTHLTLPLRPRTKAISGSLLSLGHYHVQTHRHFCLMKSHLSVKVL